MKKHIVILSAFLTPFRSGAEAAAEEVPVALQGEYDFTIVTSKLRSDLPREDCLGAHENIRVIRVGLGCSFDKWLYPFLAPLVVCRLKPDVIHAILETFAGLALHFCKYLSSAPRLLTLETTNRSFLKGFLIKSADRVTAISNVLKDIAAQNGKDAVLISNGIPYQELADAYERTNQEHGSIIFVGRLEKMKGIDTLITAFSKIQVPHASLHIVGSGSQREPLELLAESLGVSDSVFFHGRLDGNALFEAYAQAEVFCGLSRSEALGNVFIEAQGAGCAVIGTNVGGIPDSVTDGETGLLVPVDDIDAACEALEKVLLDRELREKLSAAGRKNAEQYAWDRIGEQYGEVYTSFHAR